MPRITILGAGSGFTGTLTKDIMLIPGLEPGVLALVDIDPERLELAHGVVVKTAEALGSEWKIEASTDRRKVLPGSDYIINTIEVSGVQTVRFDNDIPLKYGVKQCIGDTIGPGGIFKGLRTIPSWLEILQDAEELAPRALVLNYTNPMSMMTLAALVACDLPVVGLCHSVQGTSRHLAACMDIPYEEMSWNCAGINHMAWFTELTRDGEDLYPLLRQKYIDDPERYDNDKVRFEFMMQMGYFVTESSGHFSEYVPWFRKRDDLIETYCRAEYSGGTSFYADSWPGWRKNLDENRRKILNGEKTLEVDRNRSHEYASVIIEAHARNTPATIHGNVMNEGLIDNLPYDGCVEVRCMIDREGIHPCKFGALPPHLAALNQQHMAVHECLVGAILSGDRESAVHALMLDPLTSAVCSLEETRRMFDELWEAERDFMPDLK